MFSDSSPPPPHLPILQYVLTNEAEVKIDMISTLLTFIGHLFLSSIRAHDKPHMLSVQCVAHDLSTMASRPRGSECWSQFRVQ